MKWLFVLGALVLAAAGLWLVPQDHNDRENWEGGGVVAGSTASSPHHYLEASPRPVGTSGQHEPAAEDRGVSEHTFEDDAAIVREIETITGANDGMALIGRRVDLHVDVQSLANDNAFWVGSRDNRLLVVLGRDTRGDSERVRGLPATHHIAPVHRGQVAAISGVIRPLPKAEQMYSWDLTTDDRRELADRKIYIRAEKVSSQGHGTF